MSGRRLRARLAQRKAVSLNSRRPKNEKASHIVVSQRKRITHRPYGDLAFEDDRALDESEGYIKSVTFSNDDRVECVAKCDFVVSELTCPKLNYIKLQLQFHVNFIIRHIRSY